MVQTKQSGSNNFIALKKTLENIACFVSSFKIEAVCPYPEKKKGKQLMETLCILGFPKERLHFNRTPKKNG